MIILGSQSPRRKEILNFFSLPFRQIASNFDEESIPFTGDPPAYPTLLSQKKAEALSQLYPDDIILTADSVVFFQNKPFNKPKDAEEAFTFLQTLAGNWHEVITGVTVRRGEKAVSTHARTKLLFCSLSDTQIRQFHSACTFLDKAGGYAIEKSGSLIVSKLEGCYYNVMGLPVQETRSLLLHFGIDLWDHLRAFS